MTDQTPEYIAWKRRLAAALMMERERLERAVTSALDALDEARAALAAFDYDHAEGGKEMALAEWNLDHAD